jgi:hypothetical protein
MDLAPALCFETMFEYFERGYYLALQMPVVLDLSKHFLGKLYGRTFITNLPKHGVGDVEVLEQLQQSAFNAGIDAGTIYSKLERPYLKESAQHDKGPLDHWVTASIFSTASIHVQTYWREENDYVQVVIHYCFEVD